MKGAGRLCAAATVLMLTGVGAPAQTTSTGVPNAVQGFSKNRNAPVRIEAATLEVRDKSKVAVFSGKVRVVQGDTEMRCGTLHVFYEDGSAATKTSMPAAQAGPDGQQRIKRLEARGGVIVTQADQTATGQTGIFDMRANTITLQGNVVATRGKDVLRGDRLVVDMTSGVSRLESGKSTGGRVEGLFLPGQQTSGKPAPPSAAPAPTRRAPGQPLKLN